ncbi:RNA polymerase sigma-70 factor [Xanthocytophaga flava]|uniref:RNA polymerase sigma-70 factor n=1 Tax=Xanthocytophaga flava TaxID=3048013 RepID=UPI0028D027A7|nr:RNA polymerase sigma-70 factor [Xanthocytophaga flavus]MDJ1469707.1 RNA polymerase sigma-70 factor [Xanthocytophaga flavus]
MHSETKERLTDNQLLALLRESDSAALEELYYKYSSKLYSFAYKVLRDKDTCKDIIQEIFSQLWVRRDSIQIISLESYLYAATRFQVFNAIREGKHHDQLWEEIENRHFSNTTEEKVNEKEALHLIESAFDALPGRCREIFRMSRFEQLSTKEIATILGIAPKTVENQLTIALKRLRLVLHHLFCLTFVILSIPS